MKYRLRELIEKLHQIQDAPIHPDSGIETGMQSVFFRVYDKDSKMVVMRQEVLNIMDFGSYLTIDIQL